jgi:hypothetical protein
LPSVIALDLEPTNCLEGFNHQNVISDLEIQEVDCGIELNLSPCFGVNGTIVASQISVDFEPRMPHEFTQGKP